jgi:hypothetical protein
MQRIPQVVARQRAHLGGLVERVAHLDGAHVFAAETENTRSYQGGLWLGDLDSNQD